MLLKKTINPPSPRVLSEFKRLATLQQKIMSIISKLNRFYRLLQSIWAPYFIAKKHQLHHN